MRETPLAGGNVTDGVVRAGDTVRRPAGPWTPAVQALLRHLQAVGFRGAPEPLGVDERGRDVQGFAPGGPAWPWAAFEPLASDAGLIKVAELIAGYHAAVRSFVPLADAVWNEVAPRDGPGAERLICHNDLAPWNLILGPDGDWVFIDWDLAAPGTRLSDLAYAARGLAPLVHDPQMDLPIVRRLGLLCEIWEVAPAELIPAIAWRARADLTGFQARADAGGPPWRRMWDEGHGEIQTRITEFIEANAAGWLREL